MKLLGHKRRWILAVAVVAALAAGCGKKTQRPDFSASAEPDKVLYETALNDISSKKYDVARLTLQTLLNTYPDSEYVAQAKLAIADAYFAEGTTSALTQAVAEYKDFLTFFPFLPEAPYAQMRIAMTYYRRMEKPDRDRTNARLAEHEFQNFLQNYPQHEFAPEAAQRLREVQEVLAEGDFRIANYYYIKGSPRAAAGRLLELVDRYPLFSKADRALWMLGQTFDRAERGEYASTYYGRIVSDYPLSEYSERSKERLLALGYPVPQPKPEALERMQREAEIDREKGKLIRKTLGMFKTGPDVSAAARHGEPNLTPPADTFAGPVLTPGGTSSVGGAGGSSVGVQTVTPGPGGAVTDMPANTAAATSPVAVPTLPVTDAERQAQAKKAAEKESSSKKKRGLRRIIPW